MSHGVRAYENVLEQRRISSSRMIMIEEGEQSDDEYDSNDDIYNEDLIPSWAYRQEKVWMLL